MYLRAGLSDSNRAEVMLPVVYVVTVQCTLLVIGLMGLETVHREGSVVHLVNSSGVSVTKDEPYFEMPK